MLSVFILVVSTIAIVYLLVQLVKAKKQGRFLQTIRDLFIILLAILMTADIIYEDDLSTVIKDIQPQAPIHLLIIPKKVIPKLSDSSIEDQGVLGHLMLVAGRVAEQINLDNTFRIVINNGAKAGQSVFHLHLHLLSGRSLNWPPG